MPITIRSLGRFVDEHLGVSDDRAEDVVEVVRNAGREATDGIHFLGLAQLLFHSRAANATYVRSVHRSGMSAGLSKSRGLSFTSSMIIVSPVIRLTNTEHARLHPARGGDSIARWY
jgi:hypothetical protein